jgi:hypothetical protein
MFGFLGRFGRARQLRMLDAALRAFDLHPALVPDAVQLTAVRLLEAELGEPSAHDYAAAAELIAYCLIGASNFTAANDLASATAVEARIEAAIAHGDSLDARLVLLLLHAGLVQPAVVDRFGLEAG